MREDILERLHVDPGQRTLGQILQDREDARHEIIRLRAELDRLRSPTRPPSSATIKQASATTGIEPCRSNQREAGVTAPPQIRRRCRPLRANRWRRRRASASRLAVLEAAQPRTAARGLPTPVRLQARARMTSRLIARIEALERAAGVGGQPT